MRWLLALLMFVSVPAAAAEWGHYANARFGYGIDIPPGFVAGGEADNGDGQVFSTPTATLTVFGGHLLQDFEAEAAERRAYASADGWGLTYQVTTPGAASFSGKRGARILYARMIALCGGTAFGMFALEYSRSEITAFDAVVTRLVQSLRPAPNAVSCS